MSTHDMAGKVNLLAVLVATIVLADSGVVATQRPQEIKQYLAQTSVQATPCQTAGFTGCCNISTTVPSCYLGPSTCYCDLTCHLFDDCCPDINDTGCTPPSQTTCTDLSLTGGTIRYIPDPNSKRPGTMATYTCDDDHFLVGFHTRVCQYDLTWSGSPECRKTCEELIVPEEGTITYKFESVDFSGMLKPVRTVAVYSCSEGYMLVGIDQRICQESGDAAVWSANNVNSTCVANTCRVEFPTTGGCCNDNYCYVGSVSTGQCSCSAECFTNQHINCCLDIGCPRQSCAQAGMDNGCCSWDDTKGCYVQDSGCFCDEECRNRMDCCSDVNKSKLCNSVASRTLTEQSMGTRQYSQVLSGQSVGSRPYSQAQMASRPPEDLNQKLADAQAVRELASDLRSMSRAQERSNERQRAEWEVILNELEEIQKN